MDNRTGPAAAKLVEAVREDLGEIVDLLERALDKIRSVEVAGKGVNGLAGILKAKGNEVAQTVEVLKGEAENVARKMLHEPRKITERVDKARADEVAEARAAMEEEPDAA